MQVSVSYSGQARLVARCSTEQVELPEQAAVGELLKALSSRHGPDLGRILLGQDNRPQASLLVFVDDEQVTDKESFRLTDRARVLLMPPISGG